MTLKNPAGFKIAPQIKRYIDEIITYWNDHSSIPAHKIQFADPLAISTYLLHEQGSDDDEYNRLQFIKWLKEKGVVECLYSDNDSGHRDGDSDDYVTYPRYSLFQVRNIKPIIALQKNLDLGDSDDDGRILFFDEATNKFLYGSTRRTLKMDEDTLYFKVLVSIYLTAQRDGETSLQKVTRVLRSRFGYKAPIERKDMQSTINKSIKEHLEGKIPKGHKMFEWKKGTDTFFFNNPVKHPLG